MLTFLSIAHMNPAYCFGINSPHIFTRYRHIDAKRLLVYRFLSGDSRDIRCADVVVFVRVWMEATGDSASQH